MTSIQTTRIGERIKSDLELFDQSEESIIRNDQSEADISPLGWDPEDVPLHRLVELLEVDPKLHDVCLVLLLDRKY